MGQPATSRARRAKRDRRRLRGPKRRWRAGTTQSPTRRAKAAKGTRGTSGCTTSPMHPRAPCPLGPHSRLPPLGRALDRNRYLRGPSTWGLQMPAVSRAGDRYRRELRSCGLLGPLGPGLPASAGDRHLKVRRHLLLRVLRRRASWTRSTPGAPLARPAPPLRAPQPPRAPHAPIPHLPAAALTPLCSAARTGTNFFQGVWGGGGPAARPPPRRRPPDRPRPAVAAAVAPVAALVAASALAAPVASPCCAPLF